MFRFLASPLARLRRIEHGVNAVLDHLNHLETAMTELDQSVDALRTEVTALAGRIDTGPLDDALAEVERLNGELSAALADDATDDATIAQLTADRDAALVDAQENAASIREVATQIGSLGQPSTDPEPEPEPEPTP